MISPIYILLFIGFYFCMLLLISWITSRNADEASYFLGNKQSKWYLVAFGMIGDSLSGVTFISVPGLVANDKFSYLQAVSIAHFCVDKRLYSRFESPYAHYLHFNAQLIECTFEKSWLSRKSFEFKHSDGV